MIDHVSNEIHVSRHVNTAEGFRIQLTAAIEELIRSDFPRLIHILYRLDVDEDKLKKELKNNHVSQAEVICNMIIERQLQKLEAKKKFGGNENISEEEKW